MWQFINLFDVSELKIDELYTERKIDLSLAQFNFCKNNHCPLVSMLQLCIYKQES